MYPAFSIAEDSEETSSAFMSLAIRLDGLFFSWCLSVHGMSGSCFFIDILADTLVDSGGPGFSRVFLMAWLASFKVMLSDI